MEGGDGGGSLGGIQKVYGDVKRNIQTKLDLISPMVVPRWVFGGMFLLAFFLRIFLVHGYYIIAYALGINLLFNFVAFLSPKSGEDGPILPTQSEAEYRPFERALPEFKFWIRVVRGTGLALIASFISLFDLPVFWPLLLLYFVGLSVHTLRGRVQHMIKYKYLPFSSGKKTYGAQ